MTTPFDPFEILDFVVAVDDSVDADNAAFYDRKKIAKTREINSACESISSTFFLDFLIKKTVL